MSVLRSNKTAQNKEAAPDTAVVKDALGFQFLLMLRNDLKEFAQRP